MPIGYRVYTHIDRPQRDLIEQFLAFKSPDISDAMNRSHTMDTGIRPAFLPMVRFAGPAVTVSVPFGAFYVVKEAMQLTRPGDVLVVNAYGSATGALFGGNVCRGLRARGVVGAVLDGAVRDVSEIREDGIPVHARAVVTRMGPYEGVGEVNVPIACGQVVVNPGDIIVADEDGIVVIPPQDAQDVIAAVRKLSASLAAVQPTLLRGEITNIEKIEKILKDSGCEFIQPAA